MITRRALLTGAAAAIAFAAIQRRTIALPLTYVDPRDYSAWSDSDKTDALNGAIYDAKQSGAPVMLPIIGAPIDFTPPLDFTCRNLPNGNRSLRITGPGNAYGGAFLRAIAAADLMLDCTGSQAIGLDHFTLGALPNLSFGSGIWLAASTTRALDMAVLEQLYVSARFARGALHGFAWGSSEVKGCKWYNYQAGNAATIRLDGINRYGVASTFATVIPRNLANPDETGVSDIDFIKSETHDFTQAQYGSAWMFDGPVKGIGIFGGNTSQRGGANAYIQAAGNPRVSFDTRHSFYTDGGPTLPNAPPPHLAEVDPAGALQLHLAPSVQYQITGTKYVGAVTEF